MNKELYVSSTPHETKVALVEDDQLAEVFFERGNEYTLAGSIYKGRVTRVLPGMQSAFVDIGLERDAFLYVSDFLQLQGEEEEDEEFGQIPAPRTTIDLSKPQPAPEAHAFPGPASIVEPEGEEESEAIVEDVVGPADEDSANGDVEAPTGQDRNSAEGTRRWRGRRRRGGRRGRPDERDDRPDSRAEATSAPEAAAPRSEARASRSESAPPPGYAPIILPGESISKYRNQVQPPTPAAVEERPEVEQGHALSEPYRISDDVRHEPASPTEAAAVIAYEETEEVEAGPRDGERDERGMTVAPLESLRSAQDAHGPESRESRTAEILAALPQNQEEDVVEDEAEVAIHTAPLSGVGESLERSSRPGGDAVHESSVQRLAAPAEAPEGRTLEHEVLEDEEMEFHPVPDDISALSEVAGDEGLVLEEETLDSDSGFSERWIPKIEDVDEDEVVAAEMRGESIYAPEADEEGEAGEEEEVGSGEVEETSGRAELRASSSTAGYQQRQAERPGYERRYRDRGRRGGPRRGVRARPNNNRHFPLISDLLKEGQEILVQIAKEPIGKKGARITSHIALPGRFLVYMPTVNHIGVSRKIASEDERLRLKRIVTSERENGQGGFIVRTAAVNIKEEELRADIRFLKHLWAEIKNRTDSSKSPALIYHDLNLVERVLRDQVNADFSQIWVDTEDEYERVVRFANRFQPSLVRRVKLYTKDAPLFEQFGIQDEINRSLKSKVWLKSGGYLVINQTEALVAIDINTGKYVGKTQRLEDTIVKTNVDAVKEIVRQIRLRDLGGIIVIDFIDMDERRNRQKVMQALEEALRNDRAPSKTLQFNDFGLVAITRKRVKQSLERTLGEPCPYCTGAGFVKSVTTVCNELYIEMRKMARLHDRSDITLRVNPEVAKALKADNGKLIGEMEELTGKTVLVKSDPTLHQENFDIH